MKLFSDLVPGDKLQMSDPITNFQGTPAVTYALVTTKPEKGMIRRNLSVSITVMMEVAGWAEPITVCKTGTESRPDMVPYLFEG